MALLDRQLGFGHWLEQLSAYAKEQIVIGVCESLNQVLIFLPPVRARQSAAATLKRTICYDYAHDFACEFNGSDMESPDYAAFFRGQTSAEAAAGQLWSTEGRYQAWNNVSNEDTEITVWVSENLHLPKRLGFLEMKVGEGTGNLDVTVEAHDHPHNPPIGFQAVRSITTTVSLSTSTGDKIRLPNFLGMRGRMFKVTVVGATGSVDWGLQELMLEYEVEESEDVRST